MAEPYPSRTKQDNDDLISGGRKRRTRSKTKSSEARRPLRNNRKQF